MSLLLNCLFLCIASKLKPNHALIREFFWVRKICIFSFICRLIYTRIGFNPDCCIKQLLYRLHLFSPLLQREKSNQGLLLLKFDKSFYRKNKICHVFEIILLTENSVRHIDTLREMEAYKRHYQICCSHHELEFSIKDRRITCAICGKNWGYMEKRGYYDQKQVYVAEQDGT